MAVLPILTWPDARLRAVCAAINGDVGDLAQDMLDTMYAAPGRGLAAPQVGALLRLFVMDATWKDGVPTPQVFVNPRITRRSDVLVTGPEGCLSLPGLTTPVARSDKICLSWTDLNREGQLQDFSGFAAICIQHECDHLNGVLTIDHLSAPERRAAERDLP